MPSCIHAWQSLEGALDLLLIESCLGGTSKNYCESKLTDTPIHTEFCFYVG